MDESTDWEYDTETQMFIKYRGGCTAKIGQSHGTYWAGFVICGPQGSLSDDYESITEAKAWCDEKIAQWSEAAR